MISNRFIYYRKAKNGSVTMNIKPLMILFLKFDLYGYLNIGTKWALTWEHVDKNYLLSEKHHIKIFRIGDYKFNFKNNKKWFTGLKEKQEKKL